jgi:multiple sugar transport system permease protein
MTTTDAVAVPGEGAGIEEASRFGALWKMRADRVRFEWGSLLMLGPALALLLVLFLIPVGYSFYLGLTNLSLIGPHATSWGFTGMQNLSRIASDVTFRQSIEVTAIFVVGSVVGAVAVGLGLAMLLARCGRFLQVVVGGVVVLAWMLPSVTAAMTWYASTTAGGTFATLSGLTHADFLDSQPVLIVTLANIWSQTGFAMLVFGAALRNIPQEVLEAAALEDASPWQRLRMVVLPLLRNTTVVIVLLISLLSLANFALIYVMTDGGPGNATTILPLYSYEQAFTFNNLAYGALVGNAMVIICAVLGALYVRLSGRRGARR